MAITSTGFQAPATQRVGLKPSVYEQIINIGPEETPLLSLIGTSKVTGISHSWIIDQLAEPKKNAQIEISDFVGAGKSTKQKIENATQISTTDVMVSETMKRAATYGGKELPREVAKKAKEHKLDMELALWGLDKDNDVKKSVLKPPVIRTETTAGESAGLFYFISKGVANFTNGRRGNIIAFDTTNNWTGDETQLTYEKLMDVLQAVYDKGATPKDIFVGATLKRAINAMVERQLGNDKKANTMISHMETDFGTINFRLHRFLSKQHGLGDCLVAGDFSYMKNGLFAPTFLDSVPTSKTAEAKRYYTEYCLEVRNADAFAIGVGFKATA